MRPRIVRGCCFLLVALVAFLIAAPDASAMPMFARKYRTSCSTCHYTVPTLNTFGRGFKANGYRYPAGADLIARQEAPIDLGSEEQKKVFPDSIWPGDIPGGIPVGFWAYGRYVYSRAPEVKWNFEMPHELSIFLAGTLGDSFSFQAEAGFENSGNEIDVGFPFWLQYDAAPGFHVKMGTVEPEPYRSGLRMTRIHYNTNSFRSRNGWRLRDDHFGVEAWGAINGPGGGGGFEYHVGAVNGQGPFVDSNPTKDVYARASMKLFGLGMAGGGTPGGDPANPQPWRDDSVTVGAFAYRGKARAATGAIDEAFDVYGVNGDAGLNRIRFESVLMFMDSEIPERADRKSRLFYMQGSTVVYPWLIPLTRYQWEDADVDLSTVAPVESVIVGTAVLARANIKFLVEYQRALDDINRARRNDNVGVQVMFGF